MTSIQRIKTLIRRHGYYDRQWVQQQEHKLKHLGNDAIDALVTQFYLIESTDLALKDVFGSRPGTMLDELVRLSHLVTPELVEAYKYWVRPFIDEEDNGA